MHIASIDDGSVLAWHPSAAAADARACRRSRCESRPRPCKDRLSPPRYGTNPSPADPRRAVESMRRKSSAPEEARAASTDRRGASDGDSAPQPSADIARVEACALVPRTPAIRPCATRRAAARLSSSEAGSTSARLPRPGCEAPSLARCRDTAGRARASAPRRAGAWSPRARSPPRLRRRPTGSRRPPPRRPRPNRRSRREWDRGGCRCRAQVHDEDDRKLEPLGRMNGHQVTASRASIAALASSPTARRSR